MTTSTRHVTVRIEAPADRVAAYIRDPALLPTWAAGLAGGIVEEDGHWYADSPMGRVEVAFVADNDLGVCDHAVTLPDGGVTLNPVRVLADGDACDVVFTLRPGADTTVAAFEADRAAIERDLASLKALLEKP
jgi:hypothetical protein